MTEHPYRALFAMHPRPPRRQRDRTRSMMLVFERRLRRQLLRAQLGITVAPKRPCAVVWSPR